MLVFSQDRDCIVIDPVGFKARTKDASFNKEEKRLHKDYIIFAYDVHGEIYKMAEFDSPKSAADTLEKVFNALENGEKSFRF